MCSICYFKSANRVVLVAEANTFSFQMQCTATVIIEALTSTSQTDIHIFSLDFFLIPVFWRFFSRGVLKNNFSGGRCAATFRTESTLHQLAGSAWRAESPNNNKGVQKICSQFLRSGASCSHGTWLWQAVNTGVEEDRVALVKLKRFAFLGEISWQILL